MAVVVKLANDAERVLESRPFNQTRKRTERNGIYQSSRSLGRQTAGHTAYSGREREEKTHNIVHSEELAAHPILMLFPRLEEAGDGTAYKVNAEDRTGQN
eukprot:5765910-Pleurochrysis_carterae.AAC.2